MGSTAPKAYDPEQPPLDSHAPLLPEGKAPAQPTYQSVEAAGRKDANDDRVLVPTPDGYFPHLDIWRFMCISVVVLDHGDWRYSEHNLFFGQNWCLQYIFVICGLAFGLTRKGLPAYLSRLAAYVVVGVGLNWAAWALKGLDWKHEPWNVVFQFWFVVALIIYSILLEPLKRYLVRCAARPEAAGAEGRGSEGLLCGPQGAAQDPAEARLTASAFVAGVGVLGVGLLVIWATFSLGLAWILDGAFAKQLSGFVASMGDGMAYWAGDAGDAGAILKSTCAAVELTLSNVWLAVGVPAMFPAHQSATGWLILFNMHIRGLFLWYSGPGEKMLNGFDLMLLGLVCYYLGLMYRRQVGKVVFRYWFVWLAVCGLVWKPGTVGRLDLLMPEVFELRWRMQFLNTVYLAVFLTAGERFLDPMIFTEDKCNFINNLGLFLFLVHKAIHILAPQPWSWFIILSTGPLFYFINRAKSQP